MLGLILAAVLGQVSGEQLSQVYQKQIRRLDGRTVSCNAQQVITGHPTRIGKWVVTQEFSGDPWGFLAWWNQVRASRGMAPVSYDGNLSNWAAKNNPPQLAARCSGHHVNPNAWQIAFFLWTSNVVSAGNGFLASPAHASVLLDPAIRVAGVSLSTDGAGYAWTINARR